MSFDGGKSLNDETEGLCSFFREHMSKQFTDGIFYFGEVCPSLPKSTGATVISLSG